MGFFDKVKHFVGGHGVKVRITKVERQAPERPTFPVGDEVIKFNVEIEGDKEVTVLSHEFEFFVECKEEDNEREIQIASEMHDETTDIIGGDVNWPYQLQPGQVVKDGCCIIDVDIAGALKKMDIDDPAEILDDDDYRFYVKFTADVKGSPMDPDTEVDVVVTE